MSYLTDACTRIRDMAMEALAGSDAKSYGIWNQEGYPYFTTHVTDWEPGEFYGSENSKRIYIIDLHYHAGLITEGQPGEVETRIQDNYPTLQTFFEENPGLQTATYTTPLRYLDPQEEWLLPCPVTTRFGVGTDGQTIEIGAILRLRVAFNISINPK